MRGHVRHGFWLTLVGAAVLAGCGGGQIAATASPSGPVAAPTTSTAATPTSSPTIAATASPSAEALAACMDKATLDLFIKNLSKLEELTQAQRDTIVAALEAYDFGSDATGAKWRDDVVAAVKKGDFSGAGLGAMAIVSGSVSLKACP
jgi:hypothetical protein